MSAYIQQTSHPDSCSCDSCKNLRALQADIPENPYKDIDKMPSTRHERDDHAYETASDSESDRARKDEAIRHAPYLPKVQVWARENGPYTLRVGNQWFHCDDLVINGAEYRGGSKRSAAAQRHDSPPSNAAVYPPRRRPDTRRAQSYTRTRPEPTNSTSSVSSSPRNSGNSVSSRSQYSPQPASETQVYPSLKDQFASQRHERRDSGISVGSDATAQTGQVVPYPSSSAQYRAPARPGLERRPSRQSALRSSMRARPAVRRGNSFDVPVRSKGRKHVRFATAPT